MGRKCAWVLIETMHGIDSIVRVYESHLDAIAEKKRIEE